MKKLLALSLTFLFACSCAGSNSYNTNLTSSLKPNTKDQMFQFLFEEEQKLPVAECLKGSNKCVTSYRINDEISSSSVRLAVGWLKSAQKLKPSAIVLEINSPGGSVDAGFDLVKEIEDSSVPVTIVVDGTAASMAAYILEAGSYRIMTNRSSVMIHRAAVGGSFYGQADDWRNISDALKATDEAMLQFFLTKLTVDEDYLKEKTQGSRQWWMNYKEALKYGAIDRAVKSVKEVIKEYQN